VSESHSGSGNALTCARQLAAERRWPELARRLPEFPEAEWAGSAELAYLLSDACRRVARFEDAVRLGAAAERAATRTADARLALRVLNLLGMIAFDMGDHASAETRFQTMLDRATGWRDDEFAARAANNLGVLANIRGERELALTSYQRALAAYHRLGYLRGLAQTHYNLGISYRDLGFLEDADAHYTTALRYAEEDGSGDVTALAETERGYLRARAGDGELAESIGWKVLERMRAAEDPAGIANAFQLLAEAALQRRDLVLARDRLDQALDLVRTFPDRLLLGEVQRDRGRVFLALNLTDQAREALDAALTEFEGIGAHAEAEATRALAERL
jgi:tetratricopeptide (TPR) repeat protein